MPEEASGGKVPGLANFYIGVVELFAVLLPGAILAFLLIPWLPLRDLPQLRSIELTPPIQWACFAVASYALGHLLFGLGAVAMDPLYDLFYKNQSASFTQKREKIYSELEKTGLFKRHTGDNALNWTLAMLTLRLPGASAQLDHIEADSKFLRSLILVLLFSWPLLLYGRGNASALRETALVLLGGCLMALIVLGWTIRKFPEQETILRWLLALPVACWFLGVLRILITNTGDSFFRVCGTVSSTIATLAAFRFMDLRQKRTRLAYELLLVSLEDEKAKTLSVAKTHK